MTPCRKDLKNPPTSVGGIWTFEAKLHEARKEFVKQLQIFAKWGILVSQMLYKREVAINIRSTCSLVAPRGNELSDATNTGH